MTYDVRISHWFDRGQTMLDVDAWGRADVMTREVVVTDVRDNDSGREVDLSPRELAQVRAAMLACAEELWGDEGSVWR